MWLIPGVEGGAPSAIQQTAAKAATVQLSARATGHPQELLKDEGIGGGDDDSWLGNAEDLRKLQPSSRSKRISVAKPPLESITTNDNKVNEQSGFGVFWKEYNKVYPASVLKMHSNGSCLVQYRDGTEELVPATDSWRLQNV